MLALQIQTAHDRFTITFFLRRVLVLDIVSVEVGEHNKTTKIMPKMRMKLRMLMKRKKPKKKSFKDYKTRRGVFRAVWEGRIPRTSGGLKKDDLMINPKTGKVVSKKAYAAGKMAFKRNSLVSRSLL